MKQKILFLLLFSLLLISNSIQGQTPTLPPGVKLPDNIVNIDCYVTPQAQDWIIREGAVSTVNFAPGQTPLVGDIDGDGHVEIVTVNQAGNTLYLLNSDATVKRSFPIVGGDGQWGAASTMGRVKWDATSEKGIIIVMHIATRTMRAYDAVGNLLWTSTVPYHSTAVSMPGAVSLADLDGDGWSEIVIGSKVYAAESGILLCQAPNASSAGHSIFYFPTLHSVPANVLNNGKQQICAGNTVYDVVITSRTGTTGNIITAAATMNTVTMHNGSTPTTLDGATYVVDFDRDGNMDVVVASLNAQTTDNRVFVYVWSLSKNEIIATKVIPNAAKKGNLFIGDLDGDGYSEIILLHGRIAGNAHDATYDRITALKYDPASVTKEMKTFWTAYHYDTSGATGLTLFDFNQDGLMELVYRDENHLRIINGSLIDHNDGVTPVAAPYDLAKINCGSATWQEYPVVADVDGDGQADILTIGPNTTFAATGPLRIFKAGGGTSWAPARKVWNQFAYNALNVNEDLTIPQKPMSPATVFPGYDGILGTPDDVRPFNNFLQQQTTLSQYGVALWPAPNGQIVGTPTFAYNETADEMTVTVVVTNVGDAAFQNPFKVTAYQNSVSVGSTKYTHTYANTIAIGETVTLTFLILNFKANWLPCSFIILKINDNGDGANDQAVCDDSQGQYRYYAILPTWQDVCAGKAKPITCWFTLGATDSYQWQLSKDNATWTDIAGATAVSYTPANQKRGVTYYRVVVDNNNASNPEVINSESVSIRVRSCQLPVNHNISVMGYYD